MRRTDEERDGDRKQNFYDFMCWWGMAFTALGFTFLSCLVIGMLAKAVFMAYKLLF